MEILNAAITSLVTLAAVMLGGWLTIRNRDRTWEMDHDRQWRDVRLGVYSELVAAARSFLAFVLEDGSSIGAVPHPRFTGEMMPVFDEKGTPYRERLESAKTKTRMVAQTTDTWHASDLVIHTARAIAAERGASTTGEVSSERFVAFWAALDQFIDAARTELGLSLLDRPPSRRAGDI